MLGVEVLSASTYVLRNAILSHQKIKPCSTAQSKTLTILNSNVEASSGA